MGIQRSATALVCAAFALSISACTAGDNSAAVTPAAAPEVTEKTPRFRSAKTISSICEVDQAPQAFPGFKRVPGRQTAEMPPPFVKIMSIGADRPMTETDAERVAPGYTLLEPFSEKDSFLIDNDREIVAVIENSHIPMLTEILPNGHRIVESNRYSDRFADAGGYTGGLKAGRKRDSAATSAG